MRRSDQHYARNEASTCKTMVNEPQTQGPPAVIRNHPPPIDEMVARISISGWPINIQKVLLDISNRSARGSSPSGHHDDWTGHGTASTSITTFFDPRFFPGQIIGVLGQRADYILARIMGGERRVQSSTIY